MKWIWNLIKQASKKKLFWIILIIAIVVIALIIRASATKGPVYVTEKVQKGNLTQTVSETGTIESASAIDLNFKASGILRQLKVKEGDSVKSGDELASLDSGSIEIARRQAQANLSVAQANLDKLLAGASAEDLKVTEATVNNAKIAADNAQANYDSTLLKIDADIKTYQQNVEAAKTSLTNTQNTYNNSSVDSRQTLLTTLRSSMQTASTSLDIINNQYVNLGRTLDTASKANAWTYNTLALADEDKANKILAQNNADISDDELKQAADDALSMLNEINTSLTYLYNAISASQADGVYSQTIINTNSAAVKTEQATNSANLSGLQTASQAFETATLGATSAVDEAQASLTSAQNTLNSALANKDALSAQNKATLDSAIGAYNLAKAQYDLKKAKPRPVDIASLSAQVEQAQAAYDLAVKNLDDYIIYAPTDGVITFINFKIGEQISSAVAKPAIAMMGKADFQITVDVPESDIVKIKIGDPATITLDAYGSDQTFTGKVVFIDVAETIIQDVVYYKITVQLDPTDKEIKSGMTANIDLNTATVENVLYVSNRTIKQDPSGQKYVEVLGFANSVKRLNVEIGLKGDMGTEIKSGLSEGQDVIVSKK